MLTYFALCLNSQNLYYLISLKNTLKIKDATKPANATTNTANATTNTDNEMAVKLIPFHPPIAKLIPQLTTDKMTRIKKNVTWKNDFNGVYCWRSCKVTDKIKPAIIKDNLIVKITDLPFMDINLSLKRRLLPRHVKAEKKYSIQ
jgi:hypothetical protein